MREKKADHRVASPATETPFEMCEELAGGWPPRLAPMSARRAPCPSSLRVGEDDDAALPFSRRTGLARRLFHIGDLDGLESTDGDLG